MLRLAICGIGFPLVPPACVIVRRNADAQGSKYQAKCPAQFLISLATPPLPPPSVLTPHTDRLQCEFVVSVQLTLSPAGQRWPISVCATPRVPYRGDQELPPPSQGSAGGSRGLKQKQRKSTGVTGP